MPHGLTIKRTIQRLLKRAGLYERLKSSVLYDAYWTFADCQVITDRAMEIAFYRKTLEGFPPGALVFDVGANQGYKTDIFLRVGARVIAVDPDAVNKEIIRNRFLRYRLAAKDVTIVGKAVSDTAAITTMWIDAPGSETMAPVSERR
jgi:predicted RNA methylase